MKRTKIIHKIVVQEFMFIDVDVIQDNIINTLNDDLTPLDYKDIQTKICECRNVLKKLLKTN